MQLSWSQRELTHLAVAWLALSLGFALLLEGPIHHVSQLDPRTLAPTFALAFVTAGTGFLLHELAHKVAAQRYGFWAEFRADFRMLALAVVSGALGFLFAAPGAVEIRSRRGITRRQNGLTAVAGPVTNLALFAFFAPLALVFTTGLLGRVMAFGALINAFLAAFNMLPYGPLDGRKVKEWSLPVFAAVFAVSAALTLYSFLYLL